MTGITAVSYTHLDVYKRQIQDKGDAIMQKITIERTTAPKAKPTDETKLGFGKIFTDHNQNLHLSISALPSRIRLLLSHLLSPTVLLYCSIAKALKAYRARCRLRFPSPYAAQHVRM